MNPRASMTYVLANTQYQGRKWAKTHLGEKFKVLSTPNQIRGRRLLLHYDCLYLLTQKAELMHVLFPALVGCRVFSQNV